MSEAARAELDRIVRRRERLNLRTFGMVPAISPPYGSGVRQPCRRGCCCGPGQARDRIYRQRCRLAYVLLALLVVM